jgi:hypothetical protein
VIILKVLWSFWYIFSWFGVLRQEKSGNPGLQRSLVVVQRADQPATSGSTVFPTIMIERRGRLGSETQLVPSPQLSSTFYPHTTRVARFLWVQHTKTVKNIPNVHKVYQMSLKYTKWL